jgi:alpha-1,3-glucosyltransferase
LGVQYIAALLLWNRLMGHNPFSHSPSSFVHLLGMVRPSVP